MRIHTTLTEVDIRAAAKRAKVGFVRLNLHGSRRSDRAFDVILTGSAMHNCHWSRSGEYQAATWDEWGIFLDLIFRRDPTAYIGNVYSCREEFEWATGNRYELLLPDNQHRKHKWERNAYTPGLDYASQSCSCGAIRRWMVRGRWTPDVVEVEDNYGERYETYYGPYQSQGRYEAELVDA